jgi:ribose 1,5-bisphosphokinase
MVAASGVLVLVVGPSGAGKDSVLRGAAQQLQNDPRYVFPRRVVTRDANTDAEDHDTLSEVEFQSALNQGEFALSWQAHGNHYGIPAKIKHDIATGRIVVINVSRGIVQNALTEFQNLVVAEVTADEEIRIQRIKKRGREQSGEASNRATRVTPPYPDSVRIVRIENNADVATAVARFTGLLRSL